MWRWGARGQSALLLRETVARLFLLNAAASFLPQRALLSLIWEANPCPPASTDALPTKLQMRRMPASELSMVIAAEAAHFVRALITTTESYTPPPNIHHNTDCGSIQGPNKAIVHINGNNVFYN